MPDEPSKPESAQPERRQFLKKSAAVLLGAAGLAVPIGAGVATFLDPLRRQTGGGGFLYVTSLNALRPDGVPRRFPVIAEKSDIWNKFPNVPIGAIYLRRTPDNQIEAFNVICPHAGCPVEFRPSTNLFLCPCHDSSFDLSGVIASPGSPSPRGLDTLAVEVRHGSEVWVKFQNFRAATPEKIPV